MKTILFLAANPIDTSSLQLDKELREVKEGLRRSRNYGEFDLQSNEAVRPRDIQRAMLDNRPSFVHFSGHGNNDGIFLLNGEDNSCLVTTKALAELFQLFSDKIECVLLNSCYSEKQAEAISKSIPYVIGMDSSIRDKAAIEFSTSFYDAIGAGESITFAYKLGCNAIHFDSENSLENSTPVLHTRNDIITDAGMDNLLSNSSFKNKVSIIDRKINSVANPKTENPHKELITWVLRTVESQGNKIAKKAISNLKNTDTRVPVSNDDIEDYLMDISNFINRICIALAQNDKSVLNTPIVSQNLNINTYDTRLYTEFFSELLDFSSTNNFSKESINGFARSSEQILKNIF